ncbi:MAG: hypothetical protein B7Z40_22485 [Bosea sp. 12-68-7]|nr:MAG: hypothetical protein B7Z40_22485 [Bosea sp. 12-68-7]
MTVRQPQAFQPDSAEPRALLGFALGQDVTEGIDELHQETRGALIALQHGSATDAVRAIGCVDSLREAFIGFPRQWVAG